MAGWVAIAIAVVALLQSVPRACCLVHTRQILRSNERWILLDSFGFGNGGVMEVNASDLIIYSPEQAVPPDTSSMGFLVADELDSMRIREHGGGDQGHCPLMNSNLTRVFRVSEMAGPGPGGKRPPMVLSVKVPLAGTHSLFFINCASTRLVSATVQVRMWNVGPANIRLYLPAGKFFLSFADLVLAGLYVILLVVWLWHVLKVWFQPVVPPAYQVLLTVLLPVVAALYAVTGASLFVRQAAGSSIALDWICDVLLLLCCGLLLSAFLAGIERVDPYLTDVEKALLYTAITVWLPSQFLLVMSCNQALLARVVSPDSDLWGAAIDQLEAGVIFSLAILALLLAFEFLASCCSLLLSKRKGSSRPRDDREEDSPLAKYYVKLSLLLISASVLGVSIHRFAPFNLKWLADACWGVLSFAFCAYTLHRVRPRSEKSVYQLFDESDDVDEELSAL